MSDPLDRVAALARRARMEVSPVGSVAPAVLARLEADAQIPQRPLWAFAGASLALSLALLAGLVLSNAGADPLLAFFDAGVGLNQWGWS